MFLRLTLWFPLDTPPGDYTERGFTRPRHEASYKQRRQGESSDRQAEEDRQDARHQEQQRQSQQAACLQPVPTSRAGWEVDVLSA